MMPPSLCMQFYVEGKVQGVCFRAFVCEQAERLQLCGFARNLPDGRVEVVVCGERERILALHLLLKQGPPHATVTGVTAEELPWQAHADFSVR